MHCHYGDSSPGGPVGGPKGGGPGGGEPGGLPAVNVVTLQVSDTLFTVTVALEVVVWLEELVICKVTVSPVVTVAPVSYTHLTLPTKRIV